MENNSKKTKQFRFSLRLKMNILIAVSILITAKQVGGDFYDFFRIGDDRLALVIADVSGKFEDLVMNAFFVGIGFAVLENLVLLTRNVTLFWALIRGFASGIMHGICTGLVGICISFVRQRKKLRYSGLFGTSILAMTYHSIFNALVQSDKLVINYIGFAMPIAALVYIVILSAKQKKQMNQNEPYKLPVD